MTRLETELCFLLLCSTWDRLNGKLLSAQDRSNCKLVVQKGTPSWQILRQGVDEAIAKLGKVGEVMTKLDTVFFFVPLCLTWGRLNGHLFTARD